MIPYTALQLWEEDYGDDVEELAVILREPLDTVTRWLWYGVEPEADHQANILKTIEKAPRTAKA